VSDSQVVRSSASGFKVSSRKAFHRKEREEQHAKNAKKSFLFPDDFACPAARQAVLLYLRPDGLRAVVFAAEKQVPFGFAQGRLSLHSG
jgi:hypothetical protein